MIITLEQIKSYLGIEGNDDDVALAAIHAAAEDQIRGHLGYSPEIVERSIRINGNGRYAISLGSVPPVVGVSRLAIDGVEIAAQADRPAGIGFAVSDGVLWLFGNTFQRGRQNIEITYSAGYGVVPDAITLAVCELVAVRREEMARRGVSSKSLAGESISFANSEMPVTVAGYLAPYRRVTPSP